MLYTHIPNKIQKNYCIYCSFLYLSERGVLLVFLGLVTRCGTTVLRDVTQHAALGTILVFPTGHSGVSSLSAVGTDQSTRLCEIRMFILLNVVLDTLATRETIDYLSSLLSSPGELFLLFVGTVQVVLVPLAQLLSFHRHVGGSA